jgi:purine nucleoside permease
MSDQRQGGIARAEPQLAAVRSSTPTVYVPRRFRIDGIAGVPTGAAIVGTPQGDGMVAIDVESVSGVDPQPEVWSDWVAEAARRHEQGGGEPPTRMVSEAAVVEVGRTINGQVRIDDTASGAAVSRWIQAGRADFLVEAPFPHEI